MGDPTPVLTRRRLLHVSGAGAAALLLPRLPAATAAPAGVALAIAGDPRGPGYWVLMGDGSVVAHGTATAVGGAGAIAGEASGLAAAPRGGAFWRIRRNGAVAAFGGATVTAAKRPNRASRFVGVAATPAATGLWRVTALGNVVASGAAVHLGEPRRTPTRIAGIAAHPEATGYWILNRGGRVYGYGASAVLGTSVGDGARGLAAHPGGDGYWVVKTSGEVVAFGAASHYGNAAFGVPAVDIAAAPDGAGYWVLARDGRVAAFGSALTGAFSLEPPPTPVIATVGGIQVAATIAKRVGALLDHAADDGIRLGGWGYRSYVRQVQLREQNCGPRYYDVFVKPSSECSPMTARPGGSMHERGEAIDFYRRRADGTTAAIAGTRAFRWLSRNAKTYGLYNLPSEPWHWSTNGR